jgi:hypothetical protein
VQVRAAEQLDVPVRPIELPEEARARLRRVLELLGLRMGVVDLKLTDEGELVWLEINPQGQFLFVEGLCGLELTAAFSEFLYTEKRCRPTIAERPRAEQMAPALAPSSVVRTSTAMGRRRFGCSRPSPPQPAQQLRAPEDREGAHV